jgi:hypothetical protein
MKPVHCAQPIEEVVPGAMKIIEQECPAWQAALMLKTHALRVQRNLWQL